MTGKVPGAGASPLTSSARYRSGPPWLHLGPAEQAGAAAGHLPLHAGIRYFHGCYACGEDQLWGVARRQKGGDHTLAALRTIRQARPDGAPVYVILDNLSANKTPAIRDWAAEA